MPTIEKLLSGLNPPQRAAVEHTEGPVLTLAGAGSGKTRVITRRVAYLVASGLAAPENILAVTFTNKAAGEMRERVAELIGRDAAARTLVSTFHSFCVRVLRREITALGYRSNFTISSESDARTLLRRVLDDLGAQHERFDPGLFLSAISLAKNTGKSLDQAADGAAGKDDKYAQYMQEVFSRYDSALRAANSLDFDDLLSLTLRLWKEHPDSLAALRRRFRYVMVDEYQDTNKVQYELLLAIAGGHRNLFVVGDDDQSIYGWRGADVRNILGFEKDFPDARVITMDQNYRSTETILAAANHVIAHNTARRPKNLWSALGKGRKLDHFVVADEEEEARAAVEWLANIREKAGAKPGDFAILYRSNLQSRPFEIALRRAGVPYAVYGGQEFFERAEVKDILSYLKIIANPRDEAAFLRVVNMPRRGIGDAVLHHAHEICRTEGKSLGMALAAMLERGAAPKAAELGMRRFLSILAHFRKRFRERDGAMGAILRDLVAEIGYLEELQRTSRTPEQYEVRRESVEAVVNAAALYEADAEHPSLSGFLDTSSLNGGDKPERGGEKRQDAVSLMTIHSAKGLEFPFVFIVGMEEGTLPHDRSVKEGGLEEERRLFYVALTRGQRHVTLFEAVMRTVRGKEKTTKPSRFLAELPPDLVITQIRAARAGLEAAPADPPPPRKRKPGPRRQR
ncbi:MAG TPA: UvrD-helicase domain-containing protein [Candidatus Hydrogenedentes bacterium]|nr:UvrD-helicase domain-containing protein [Candidatus Hydrogenedentota bacterium]